MRETLLEDLPTLLSDGGMIGFIGGKMDGQPQTREALHVNRRDDIIHRLERANHALGVGGQKLLVGVRQGEPGGNGGPFRQQRPIGALEGGHLRLWIDAEIFGLVLLALRHIYKHEIIGRFYFFKQHMNAKAACAR